MLDGKLQIKDGKTIAILYSPYDLEIAAARIDENEADAVLVFATNKAELDARIGILVAAATRGAAAWVAYPKAKQLNTDLNRDIIHDLVPGKGLDTVRQIAIDDTWSAMRLKYVGN